MDQKKAFVIDLIDTDEHFQRLLPGPPKTCTMKSGRVYLKPETSCGLHSTEDKEEQLVFLQGKGQAVIEGKALPVGKGKIVYIPPKTQHDIKNTGSEPLVYIYCVAQAL